MAMLFSVVRLRGMKDYHVPLEPGSTYHLLSRAIGAEELFVESRNYPFFIKRYRDYTRPIADTYAYSLLSNHFHVSARIKDEGELVKFFREEKKLLQVRDQDLPKLVMQQFSNFLNSYAKSINSVYGRIGSLFVDGIRRVKIEGEEQFIKSVMYIHMNAVKHGLCKRMKDWPWSSVRDLSLNKESWLAKKEVWNRFGGREMYMRYHRE